MTHPLKHLGLVVGLLLLLTTPMLAQDDGRINGDAPAAPVILFCNEDGFVIRNQGGQPIVFVPFSDIPAAADEPLVIASNSQLDLYRAQRFLQLEAPFEPGEKYVYRWPGTCTPGSGTSTFEPGSAGFSLPVGRLGQEEEEEETTGVGSVSSTQIIGLDQLPVVGPSASINVTGIDLRRAGYGITNFDILTLRTGAGADYQPLALFEGGVFVNVLGRNSADTWLLVETATGVSGWLRASGGGESADEFIIRRGNLSGIPVIPESQMGAKAPATLVTSRANTLYSTDSLDFDAELCQLAPGEYIVNGSNDAGDWLQIQGMCTDGRMVTGWIQEIEGALRNPSGGLLPIIGSAPAARSDDGFQVVQGPAFVFYLPRTLYGSPSLLGDILCEAAPNRYAIVGRTQNVTWYEIQASCLDGTPVRGWLQSTDGLFQTNNNATVPITG